MAHPKDGIKNIAQVQYGFPRISRLYLCLMNEIVPVMCETPARAENVMAHLHFTGRELGRKLGRVQGTGPGTMGPNMLYGNVHTGLSQRKNHDALFPVVLVQFPVLVPMPFSAV